MFRGRAFQHPWEHWSTFLPPVSILGPGVDDHFLLPCASSNFSEFLKRVFRALWALSPKALLEPKDPPSLTPMRVEWSPEFGTPPLPCKKIGNNCHFRSNPLACRCAGGDRRSHLIFTQRVTADPQDCHEIHPTPFIFSPLMSPFSAIFPGFCIIFVIVRRNQTGSWWSIRVLSSVKKRIPPCDLLRHLVPWFANHPKLVENNLKDPTPQTRVVEGYALGTGAGGRDTRAARRATKQVGEEEEDLSFGEGKCDRAPSASSPHGSTKSIVRVRERLVGSRGRVFSHTFGIKFEKFPRE